MWGFIKAHLNGAQIKCPDHSEGHRVRDRLQLEYRTDRLKVAVWHFGLRWILRHIHDWHEQRL